MLAELGGKLESPTGGRLFQRTDARRSDATAVPVLSLVALWRGINYPRCHEIYTDTRYRPMDSGEHRGRGSSDGPSTGAHPENPGEPAADHSQDSCTTVCRFDQDGAAAQRREANSRSLQPRAGGELAAPVTFAPSSATVRGHFRFRVRDAQIDTLTEYLELLGEVEAVQGLEALDGYFTVAGHSEATAGTSLSTFRDRVTDRILTPRARETTGGPTGRAVFIAHGAGDAVTDVVVVVAPSPNGSMEIAGGVWLPESCSSIQRLLAAANDLPVDVGKPKPISPNTNALDDHHAQKWITHMIESSEYSALSSAAAGEAVVPNPYYTRAEQLARDLGYSPSRVTPEDMAKCSSVAAVRFIRVHADRDQDNGQPSRHVESEPASFELTDWSPVLPLGAALNVNVRIDPGVLG